MKKYISLFVALVLSVQLFAGEKGTQGIDNFGFGLRITPGLSYFKVDKTGLENDKLSYSFGYGIDVEYKLSDYVSFSTGALMNSFRGNLQYNDSVYLVYDVTKSGITTLDTAAQLLTRKYTFRSVDIPLKLKLKTPEIGYLTYFGEIGLTLNIIYDAYSSKNAVILNEGQNTTSVLEGDLERIDEEKDANWFRAGLNVGGGVEYNLVGNTNLLVGINWNNSFTNILSKNSESIFYQSSGNGLAQIVKADYVALSIGIQF